MSVVVSGTFVRVTWVGTTGTGPISVPGLKVGDALVWLYASGHFDVNLSGNGYYSALVTTDDEIHQTDNNQNGWTFDAIFVRGGV